MKCLLFAIILLALSTNCFPTIKLPSLLSDNAVLQQRSKVKLWGETYAGNLVTITTSWDNKVIRTTADDKGKFLVFVNTPEYGGPYTITFNDGEEMKINNILIGEVWLCSGQSNMQMQIKGSVNQPVLNSAEIIAKSNNLELRLFRVMPLLSEQPMDDRFDSAWEISSPVNVANFSAVAYQFGQMLQEYFDIPVGIILSGYGGTSIRGWMDKENLNNFPTMSKDTAKTMNRWGPSYLYNAMIFPLRHYHIKGFLWYQGERDVNSSELYEKMLPVLVNNWRNLWNLGDLPFYYAQIAPWLYSGSENIESALLREAQFNANKKIKNAGIIPTIDAGSDLSIHPPDKTTVAKRFFYLALAKTYLVSGIPCSFPEFNKIVVEDDELLIHFNNLTQGLSLHHQLVEGIEVAGSDKIFYPATSAQVVGKIGLRVKSKDVKKPIAIRYCFKNYSKGNLFDNFGMPAFPFRSDNW